MKEEIKDKEEEFQEEEEYKISAEVKFTDINSGISVTIANCPLDLLEEMATELEVVHLLEQKFYKYGRYDKFSYRGFDFTILKMSKKAITLLYSNK